MGLIKHFRFEKVGNIQKELVTLNQICTRVQISAEPNSTEDDYITIVQGQFEDGNKQQVESVLNSISDHIENLTVDEKAEITYLFGGRVWERSEILEVFEFATYCQTDAVAYLMGTNEETVKDILENVKQ